MIPKTCKHCGGPVSEERDVGISYYACDKCGHSYGSKPNNVKPGRHLKKGDDDLYYSVKKRIQLKPSKNYITTPKIYNKKAFEGHVDDLFKHDNTPKFKRKQLINKKQRCKK